MPVNRRQARCTAARVQQRMSGEATTEYAQTQNQIERRIRTNHALSSTSSCFANHACEVNAHGRDSAIVRTIRRRKAPGSTNRNAASTRRVGETRKTAGGTRQDADRTRGNVGRDQRRSRSKHSPSKITRYKEERRDHRVPEPSRRRTTAEGWWQVHGVTIA